MMAVVGGAGRQGQYLIDRGIKQNRTMGEGSVRPAVLCGRKSIYREGYIECSGQSGGEGVDIGVEEKTITNGNNQLLSCLK
jgi:hypothetical protein